VVKSVHTSGLDAEAEGGEETIGSGTKGKESQRRKGLDNIPRENCKEEKLLSKSDDLVCFYINARNLLNKFDQFEAWVHELNPDVIGVTETWATPLVADSELALVGYDMFRQDRPVNREGGGVLLYVRSSLHAVQCELSVRFPEQSWCYFLDANKNKCYLGICYRTPTYGIYSSHNHDLLKELIAELCSTKKHFVLMGDFNYRFKTWPPNNVDNDITREAAEFYECLEENFFTQFVEECTRNDAILDLVIADEPDVVHDVNDIGTFPGSDHQALLWKIQVKTTLESVYREIFDYGKADMKAIKQELQSVVWDDVFRGLSAEQCWLAFRKQIESLQWKYIPVKGRLNKQKKPVWMTNKALRAVRHRRCIYRKYKDTSHPAYINAAKLSHKLVDQAKRKFEEQLARKIKDDRKSFFAYARSKSKSSIRIGSLVEGQGQLVTEAVEKADALNDFFASVFTREDVSDVPTPVTYFSGSDEDKLRDISIDPLEIAAKLSKLKSDKAAGDDNMAPRFLKDVSNEIAVPVAMIFRKSLDTGQVPRDWRNANITPLFKHGNRSKTDNYRPVSLTSQICKIVESVLRDKLVSHLEKYELLQASQHGFRSGFSCGSNLLSFLETVTSFVDSKEYVDAIYLDLAKAFDKVPHHRLLLKLEAHGISGLVSNWIKAWLADRRQRVIVDGSRSQWREVWSGVPQGSVLGPVLFLIFINDLDQDISSGVLKFADDTKLYCTVSNQMDSIRLQKDLDTVIEWANRWQMQFNVKKCKVVHFGKGNLGFTYSMAGQCLEEVDYEKDLGVVVSKDLKVVQQCQESYSKANRMLGLISRTIKYKNQEVLMNLYKSMVRPHLEYCCAVWSPHYIKDKQMLEKVQHRFTRMFPHLKNLPYEDRLSELGLWSLEERRNRADIIEVFKMVKQLSSVPWSRFFKRAEDSVTRGHSWKLVKESCRLDCRLHFFSQRVINRWNSLSQADIDATTVNSFKNRLEMRRKCQMGFFKD